MIDLELSHQPTVRQLLQSELLSETQIVCCEDNLDRPVARVVSVTRAEVRPYSLVVASPADQNVADLSSFRELAAVAVVVPSGLENRRNRGRSAAAAPPLLDGRLTSACQESGVPLLVVPGFADCAQAVEDIRFAYQSELKRQSGRLYQLFVTSSLSGGLEGLVESLSARIQRPAMVETADFKLIAAVNMGSTPAGQQRVLAEEAQNLLKRRKREPAARHEPYHLAYPVRIGRRLVMPVVLEGLIVGYLSAMVRATDDTDALAELMAPAALAAAVGFSHQRKDSYAFGATQTGLLKDLLSGRRLSGSDIERLEQHFGFDLCDRLLVLALNLVLPSNQDSRAPDWSACGFVCVEVEGTRAFVVPLEEAKDIKQLAGMARGVASQVRNSSEGCGVQVGMSRPALSVMDLPEAYREARQALVVGSMIHEDAEFVLSYGQLGVRRLLYLMIDHPELQRFYEENLSVLEAYDEEWESELVDTLRVYLAQGANLNSAARELHVHRHTLRYRLEQIAEILKVDIDSEEVLLDLKIAFLIKEMKGRRRR